MSLVMCLVLAHEISSNINLYIIFYFLIFLAFGGFDY